jgi:nucleoside-diphosphate-sugar epimerase
MKVLLIGGTRFIGPAVVRRLAAAGHTVMVFHRGRHVSALPEGVRSVRDPRAGIPVLKFPRQLLQFEPEIVVHMIAMGERDAVAAREAFANVARRIVMVSSGDVYRAYGIFSGIESGPVEPNLLTEDSELRSVMHPYRAPGMPSDRLEYFYDKILAERAVAAEPFLPATILRLPKLYGPDENADLATVYGFRRHPAWRWTHGFVENVAAAIALAVMIERAAGRTYNVGEMNTPTIRERLNYLPSRPDAPEIEKSANFEQNLACDTTRIRTELGFVEIIAERQAMISTVTEYLKSRAVR